jgi:hypothetical protein
MNESEMGLWEAYIRAEYWVGFPEERLLLRVGENATGLSRLASEAAAGLFGPEQPWAYLTAWNPGSKIQMDFLNRKKQEELELFLRGSGYTVLHGVARDPREEWPDEESILVFGLGWEKALLLGRKFNQHAILAGLGEETVQLLRC